MGPVIGMAANVSNARMATLVGFRLAGVIVWIDRRVSDTSQAKSVCLADLALFCLVRPTLPEMIQTDSRVTDQGTLFVEKM